MRNEVENLIQSYSNSQIENEKIWENLVFQRKIVLSKDRLTDSLIFFLLDGSMTVSIDGSNAYAVRTKEMFLVSAGSSCVMEISEHAHIMTCHLPFESFYAEKNKIDDLNSFAVPNQEVFFKLPVRKNIIKFLNLLCAVMKDGLNTNSFFEIKKNELNLLLFVYYSKEELFCFLHDTVSQNVQFRRFVINNYLSAKNVQELAKRANYSTSGFIKKFQRNFNESPYKWIQRHKAKQIHMEINKGIKSLQEIAGEYKFSSYQHFSGFCKSQLGFPPSELYGKNV